MTVLARARRAAAIALASVASLGVVACGGSDKPSHPSAARPPLPAGAVVHSCGTATNHVLGSCLPTAPKQQGPIKLKLTPNQSTVCVDLSNNDPIYGAANWKRIAAHTSCAIFKVNEGTGYVDHTAAAMARDAKAAGLVVGGYDFQHVCGNSAVGEADLFASLLKADGLTGPNTLPGWADVEYGNGSCGARNWESQWHARVTHDLGREPGSYTGAWFWNPTFGCGYWPGGLSWISGYGISYPFMPCGHSKLDLFQNSDHGYNGLTNADLSYWYGGKADYIGAIQGGAPVVDKYAIFDKTVRTFGSTKASEYNTVKTWDVKGCKNPVRRPICKATYFHLTLLTDRLYTVAGKQGVHSAKYNRAARYKGLSDRASIVG